MGERFTTAAHSMGQTKFNRMLEIDPNVKIIEDLRDANNRQLRSISGILKFLKKNRQRCLEVETIL